MVRPNVDDEFQYSLKFQILTDVSGAHHPDLTQGHQQSTFSAVYAQFIVCHVP